MKSIPRDSSTSDCCQKVSKMLGFPPTTFTWTFFMMISLYSNYKKSNKLFCRENFILRNYLCNRVGGESVLKFLEDVIDECMPTIEDWVPHSCCYITHHAKSFLKKRESVFYPLQLKNNIRFVFGGSGLVYQVSVIWIVDVG